MAATRPIVSYDDITLPYDQPMEAPVSTATRLPSKKQKRNNKATQQRPKTHQHWDASKLTGGTSGHANFPQNAPFINEEETTKEFRGYEQSRELLHEEIWDDSALIEAWDAATEEYEAYNGPDKGWKKEPLHKSALWYNVPPMAVDINKMDENSKVSLAPSLPVSRDDNTMEADSQPLNFDTFIPTHNPDIVIPKPPAEDYAIQDPAETMVSRDEAFTRALNAMYWGGYWTAVYHCQNQNSQQSSAQARTSLHQTREDNDEDESEDEDDGGEESHDQGGFVSTQR